MSGLHQHRRIVTLILSLQHRLVPGIQNAYFLIANLEISTQDYRITTITETRFHRNNNSLYLLYLSLLMSLLLHL